MNLARRSAVNGVNHSLTKNCTKMTSNNPPNLLQSGIINIKSIFTGTWTKTRLLRAVTLFRMREGRGSGMFSQVWDYFQKLTMIGLAAKLFNMDIPFMFYPVIGVTYISFCYLLGFYDEVKLKWWQMEQEMNISHINPYYQRIEAKLDSIEQRLNRHDKRR